jgi:AcrR family transcriptional regulator
MVYLVMANVKKRLTHRQRQALATRKLIVDTARDLFLEQGYVATTIEAISVQAGVAVSTVYAAFGSKRGILQAIREVWHEESGQRDIYRLASEQPDPARRLELAAHATRRQWETSASMINIYRGAATADQEAAAELELALRGRRDHLNNFIHEMSAGLRPDLPPERAVDVFFALTLPEIYEDLVGKRGWSPDEYEEWLAEALKQQLLPLG